MRKILDINLRPLHAFTHIGTPRYHVYTHIKRWPSQ